jgi:hypothetical protein
MVTEPDGEWVKWEDADREIAVLNRMILVMATEIKPKIKYFDENNAKVVTENVEEIIARFRAEAEKGE